MALNLAKRPFVDTRPVNALTALLVVLVLGLTAVSWRTFSAYLAGSEGTQGAITSLQREITRYENARRAGEAALARFDVEQLGMSAEDANEIARLRSFSWTRFLTRLEQTLPPDVRVIAIALQRNARAAAEEATSTPALVSAPGVPPPTGMPLELTLISRDPLGLPNTIRAFYASPWFDRPTPHTDVSPERGSPEGRRIAIGVLYLDAGRAVPPPAPPVGAARAAAPTARPVRAAAAKGAAR